MPYKAQVGSELTESLVGLIFLRFFLKSFCPYLDIRGFAWAEFSVEEALTRNPESYQHLL